MIIMSTTLSLVLEILVSLATLIPLVIELIKYVQKAVKEKNWQNMLRLAINLMSEAEEKFGTGSDRKEWVIDMLQSSASTINYDLDEEVISSLIDNIIALTKVVNVEVDDNEVVEEGDEEA